MAEVNTQLLLTTTELLEAIQTDNLDLTRTLVEKINSENDKDIFFNIMLIDNNKIDNESYKYMISNLNVLVNNDVVQWNYQIKNLLNSADKKAMRKFILKFLDENTVIPNYTVAALTQICITIDRYDLLNKIRAMEEKI